ncbi:MAG: SET domain-containing protein-lysine N-methyltransferase [Alphaproteobacteria bacterium]|nr:SET domain-containing protein-lysine N-methyltransferase [Alphaproteobacteria bacterium]
MQPESFAGFIVKSSPIHGRGLFAARLFQQGEVVLHWTNAKELSNEEYENLPESERPYVDINHGKIFLMGKPERFVNHSCNANTTTGDKCDIAVKDINEGEEITADYAECIAIGQRMTCSCGSSGCQGTIVGRQKVG